METRGNLWVPRAQPLLGTVRLDFGTNLVQGAVEVAVSKGLLHKFKDCLAGCTIKEMNLLSCKILLWSASTNHNSVFLPDSLNPLIEIFDILWIQASNMMFFSWPRICTCSWMPVIFLNKQRHSDIFFLQIPNFPKTENVKLFLRVDWLFQVIANLIACVICQLAGQVYLLRLHLILLAERFSCGKRAS